MHNSIHFNKIIPVCRPRSKRGPGRQQPPTLSLMISADLVTSRLDRAAGGASVMRPGHDPDPARGT